MNFEFDMELGELLTLDYGDVWERISEVIYNPSSDPAVAVLVFGIMSIFIATVLLIAIMFVLGSGDEDDDLVVVDSDADVDSQTVSVSRVAVPRAPRSPVPALVFTIFAAAMVWLSLSYGTSSDAVCVGCHTTTAHTAADDAVQPVPDAHESLDCVDCHESGSAFVRLGLPTVERVGHLVYGFGVSKADDYGPTTTAACMNCHSVVMTKTIKDQARGVAVSHKEPVEAGARCVDCHALVGGVVQAGPGGMSRCLRCHDGSQASSECESCHFEDISVASSAPRSVEATSGRAIIETPDCGGCHNLTKSCDPCHGIRLPHSPEFVRGQHARPAAESYWYGDGQACSKCHNEGRRSCGTCHRGKFWAHPKDRAVTHQSADPVKNGCSNCHYATTGTLPNRNFCIDLCHTDREEWRGEQ